MLIGPPESPLIAKLYQWDGHMSTAFFLHLFFLDKNRENV